MKEYRGDQRTVKYILEDKAATLGELVFVQFKDKSVTYAAMNEVANRVGNALLKLGVEKGDHLLVMLPNGLESLYSWFGAAKIGVVDVPVNVNFKGAPLLHVIKDSRARCMIIHSDYLERLDAIKSELPELRTLIVHGGGNIDPQLWQQYDIVDFEQLLIGEPTSPEVNVKASDPATIMYTSGTTGPPKGAVQPQTYAYMYGKIATIPGFGGGTGAFIEEDDIYYSYLPLYHTAGRYVDVMGTMLANARIVLAERFSPNTFWTEASQYGATVTYLLFAAAYLYRMPPQPDDASNTIRKALVIPLIPEIHDFAKRFNIEVYTAYGLSEGGSVFMCKVPQDLKDIRLMGKPRDDFEIRLADEDGYEVPIGKVGEILQRPKEPYSTMLGYYGLPEKTIEVWKDLWLHTGDLAYRDEQGYYYFAGRLKEVIRRRGENIPPEMVEREINKHPAILESAVIGVPSEFGMAGENEIMAVVVLKEGQRLKPEELISFLEPRLPYFMIPRYIKFVAEFPLTSTGKVKRTALQEKWSEGEIWDVQKSGIKLKR